MEVYPLSIPKVDWNIYISTYKETFGKSPAALIDNAGLSLDSPASFVSTLDFGNNTSPNDVLRNAAKTMILEHSFCSFIYLGDKDVLTSVPLSSLSIAQRETKRNNCYAVLTGNIFVWRQCLFSSYYYQTHDSELKEFISHIRNFLYQAGFKEALL